MSEEDSGEYYYEDEDDAGEENEQDWILDTIVDYLKSPMWKNPILAFVDDHCACFDEEDENKLEYTAIHNKFKELLEAQLTDLLLKIGID